MKLKLGRKTHVFTVRRLFLVCLNVTATLLTLLTGLRENPVVVFVSARYDSIRARLREGGISYDIVHDDAIKVNELADLDEVGQSYRFFSAPRRSPSNLGEDRSTCVRVNSMNATVMTLNYNDFWGKGPRRTQIFLYSISAPKCSVLNLRPEWVSNCTNSYGGDEHACHRHILDNFDALSLDRVIHAGVERDFGEPGAAFLKCRGRPDRSFEYQTDLMVHQSYWAGGQFHVEIQTSDCRGVPLIRNDDWQWGLFKVEPVNYDAVVNVALPQSGWIGYAITLAYGIVSIAMIFQGIVAVFMQTRVVSYIPHSIRFGKAKTARWTRYLMPFMPIASLLTEHEHASIVFKGSLLMGSDIWMNHWLYIWLSVLDGIVNLRMSYIILEMGTWMLGKQVNFENFLFLCAALTKITWVMCLVHTVFRLGFKFIVRSIRNLNVIKSTTRDKLEWYVDASAMFLSYKVYNLLLCFIFFLQLMINGTTTMMKKEEPYKRGVYGGSAQIASFWGNEIICDLFVLLSSLALCGFTIGFGMLFTEYRHVPQNTVMRLLQSRYILVGWDAILACQMLGIDPYNPAQQNDKGIMYTQCSLGSLLQLLYASGPSGFVHLAGDYLFTDAGFGGTPTQFRYSIKREMAIGLVRSNRDGTYVTASRDTETQAQARYKAGVSPPPVMVGTFQKHSIFDRHLKIVFDDMGRILLVDDKVPGTFSKNAETGIREYVVQDALSYMSILDIKPLMGNDKKLKFD